MFAWLNIPNMKVVDCDINDNQGNTVFNDTLFNNANVLKYCQGILIY